MKTFKKILIPLLVLAMVASFLGVNFGVFFITSTHGLQLPIVGFDMCNKQYINLVSSILFLILAMYTLMYCQKKEHNVTVVS